MPAPQTASEPKIKIKRSKQSDPSNDIELIQRPADHINQIEQLATELYNNKVERRDLAAVRKDLERKLQRNKLKQKQKKWYNRDATFGAIAAGGISTLYTGVEYVRNFLSPGVANLIMPFFILADIGTAVSAWKIALYDRKIRALKRDAGGKSTWVGSRNSLLRAIFETAWATVGSAVVLGAIISSTFLTTAAAGAFAVFIAPVFMLVLGTRTIFNAISSGFHFIRAQYTKYKASQLEAGTPERKRLEKQADRYQDRAKIQAIAAATSAIGFVATTLVMLTHHFSFGFVGVIGGVALGGFMTYLFKRNSEYSSFLKEKRKGKDGYEDRMQDVNIRTTELELRQTKKSKQLVGLLPNLADFAKKAVRFAVVPAGLSNDSPSEEAPTEASTIPATQEKAESHSSYKAIQITMDEADKKKQKHPERTPNMAILRVDTGDKSVNIPINSDDGSVITKTRFGIYTQRTAEAAPEQEQQDLKMVQKA